MILAGTSYLDVMMIGTLKPIRGTKHSNTLFDK